MGFIKAKLHSLKNLAIKAGIKVYSILIKLKNKLQQFIVFLKNKDFEYLYKATLVLFFVSLVLITGQRAFVGKIGNFFRTRDAAQFVEVSTVSKKIFADKLTAVGTLISPDSVTITTEVTGIVEEIYFSEGQLVKKDEPLIKVESTAYEAAVEIARANLELSRMNANRNSELLKNRIVTKQAYDESQANFKRDTAALSLALNDYEKTLIRAPFDGVIGLKAVSGGMYLRPGDKIANIENIQSMQVDFELPERYLENLEAGMKVEISTDLYKDKIFAGEIVAIDPRIDESNRTIKVRANLANRDSLLRPGSFARVSINYDVKEAAAIPEMGMVKNQEGNTAFILKEESSEDKTKEEERKKSRTVLNKFFEDVMFASAIKETQKIYYIQKVSLQIGRRANDEIEIIDGVKDGDIVVTAGHQKIFPGKKVKIRDQKTE